MAGRSERNYFGPTPGGAIVSVASQGYLYGGNLPHNSASTGSGAGHTANVLGALMFVLPFTITVRKVSMVITAAFGVGQVFNLGIYSADKNTKLIEASFDGNSATRQVVTLATPVVLTPGVYWYVWAPSGGATGQYFASVPGIGTGTGPQASIPAQGTAANPMVGGILPATLGVITTTVATIGNVCAGIFYP